MGNVVKLRPDSIALARIDARATAFEDAAQFVKASADLHRNGRTDLAIESIANQLEAIAIQTRHD